MNGLNKSFAAVAHSVMTAGGPDEAGGREARTRSPTPREGRMLPAGYLSELLGRRPLRQVSLGFAAGALVLLLRQHGRILGDGPARVGEKPLSRPPLKGRKSPSGHPRKETVRGREGNPQILRSSKEGKSTRKGPRPLLGVRNLSSL